MRWVCVKIRNYREKSSGQKEIKSTQISQIQTVGTHFSESEGVLLLSGNLEFLSDVLRSDTARKNSQKLILRAKKLETSKAGSRVPYQNDAVSRFAVVHQPGTQISWITYRLQRHALHPGTHTHSRSELPNIKSRSRNGINRPTAEAHVNGSAPDGSSGQKHQWFSCSINVMVTFTCNV